MSRRPEWSVEGRDWPNRAASRFVDAGGLSWHVQVQGEGPALLLLHGTGAATHSWRDLAPELAAAGHTIIAPDLPGHGFTTTPARTADFSLPAVASAVRALLDVLGLEPTALIGHSAGAAIAIKMALDGLAAPQAIISYNGALLPFPGPFGALAPVFAKATFYNPFSLPVLSHMAAQPGAVARIIRGSGSKLDPAGAALYEQLFARTSHVEAALGLMAHWDLQSLRDDLGRLAAPLTLIVAENDLAVPPSSAREVERRARRARIVRVPGLGHLAHEENPALFARLTLDALAHNET